MAFMFNLSNKTGVLSTFSSIQEATTGPMMEKITGKSFPKFEPIQQSHSSMPYYSSLESLRQFGQSLNPQELKSSPDEVRKCAILSNWIYHTADNLEGFDEYNYKKIVNSNKSTQVVQWVFLQSNKTKTAFLIFKGTDIRNPQDLVTDLGMIPSPVYSSDDKIEISCHGLMEVSIRRDYQRIISQIQARLKYIDTLYITGHSLGGGLSIVFGLKAIIDGLFPLKNNKSAKIIAFAAPCVVAIETDMNKLSQRSKQYLNVLHNMLQVYVNRFDVVPRLLSFSGIQWVDFISKAVNKYIKNWRQHIMNKSSKLISTDMKASDINTSNVTDGVIGGVTLTADMCKAHFFGTVCHLYTTAGKSIHELGKMCKDGVLKTQSFGSVLNDKITKMTQDEYKYECDEEKHFDDGKENDNIFGTLQILVELIKKNCENNLALYQPYGTYHFYTSQCEASLSICDRSKVKKLLSYIPTRLSFNTETMQMLFSNHMMTEYLKLFETPNIDDKNNPNLYVAGYLSKIKSGIVNGSTCGNGGLFWILECKKQTPIGKLRIERHIGDVASYSSVYEKISSTIRNNAFWSSHNKKYRLVFHIWGYPKFVEVKASDDRQELIDSFNAY